ncbi:MAG: DUF523 domain-containing protein [Gammaproteobacteria bacterium]|jgi:uncharacterized protein YbbK (DUF523 family)|nr:DUF523 domain-containing protein [Gammaproteobacteria bacterium]NCF80838.1 DUF523 domain-containing protein [Pseudomonadota bacterium]
MIRGSHERILVGISSCLLGQPVRYDGGHKRDGYLIEVLGKHFEFLPLCPEVAIGMGIPRPPIRLTGDPSRPRAVGVQVDGLDVTDKLIEYAHSVMASRPRISGYIFKQGSPTCGMAQVAVYNERGESHATSSGLYAGVVMGALPSMPVAEEGRLTDAALRDKFVEQVYSYHNRQRSNDR